MKKMKKIIAAGTTALIVASTTATAQDDVSIMDLKETVYLLMKDVQGMKARQKSFTKKGEEIVGSNSTTIKAIQSDIADTKKQMKEDRNRDLLEGYTVSSELKNFANK